MVNGPQAARGLLERMSKHEQQLPAPAAARFLRPSRGRRGSRAARWSATAQGS